MRRHSSVKFINVWNRRLSQCVVLGLMGLSLCWIGWRSAQAVANTWTTKAPMTTARQNLAVATLDGKLYAVGGIANNVAFNALEVYNPVANTWTTKANLPTARYDLAAATINGQLYAVGGSNSSFQATNTLTVYDPVANAWTTKAAMPTTRTRLAAAAINGKLYAVGGYNGSVLNTLEVYDPQTDTWTTKASMPTARQHLGIAVIDGQLFAVGGFNGSQLNTLEVYDPQTDTWTTKATMPAPRYGLAAAEIDGKLYAVGGANTSNSATNTLMVYDPVTDTWTTKATMTAVRVYLAAAAIGGKLYAVGGLNGSVLNTLEVYETPEPNAWTGKTGMPTGRMRLAAVAINGKLYAVGGDDNGNYKNALEVYDPVANTWTTKANMPTARYGLATVEIDGKLYAVGGYNGGYLNTLEVYDPATDTWTTKATMPTARRGFAAAAIDGQLYAVGGSFSSNKLEVYDPVANTWTTKANLPTGREYLAAVAIDGKLYTVGGYNSSNVYLNNLEVYDPATDTWTTKANMPTARALLAAAAIDGKLYAVGGQGAGVFNTLEVYDPATDTWTTKASMPTTRGYLAAAAIDGKFYAVGGSLSSNKLEVFQVASDLTLAKSHTGNFTQGSQGQYSLAVTNNAGANYTTGVITLTDTLPAGLSYVSASGTGWDCIANGQIVTCTNASTTLAPGQMSSLTLTVQAAATGSVTNQASVSTSDELVTNNNSASDPTTVVTGCPTITVTNPATNTGTAGSAFSQTFTQSGGAGTVTFSLASGSLPTGLTLASNGTLSGTPRQIGTFPITVKATDGNNCTGTGTTYSLTINCNSNLMVTSNADSGAGSLREGIGLTCASGTITFAGGINLITLTGGELAINKNLTINGPGANLLTISGNNASRVFNIGNFTVALDGLTIANGKVNGSVGGGIYNTGTLTLTNSALSGNSAVNGYGGGIVNGSISSAGTLTITGSTISGNSAATGSGGIYNLGTLTITGSTISGNSTTASGALGGGIFHDDGVLTITSSTIFGNSSTGIRGGGVVKDGGTMNVRNTIIAGNSCSLGVSDTSGIFTSLGNNLIGSIDQVITPATGDQIGNGVNPLLAPLGNYGGPTNTHALLPGSPALNAGNNCVLTNTCASNNLGFNLTTDQRGAGFNRQVGSAVDIGAFESGGFTLALTATNSGNNQSTNINTNFANPLAVTVTANSAGEPVNGGRVTFTPPVSGARATIAGNPATFDSSGAATSGTVTANGVGGSYPVQAGGPGLNSVSFDLTNIVPNTTPTFTPAAAISRQKGSPAGAAITVGTVNDGQTAPGSLTVTQIAGGTATGITVTSIANGSGAITALVSAACDATAGTVRFQVSDGSLVGTGELQVNVTANDLPTLAYSSPQAVTSGGSLNVSPTANSDNGTINSYQVLTGHGLTTAPTVNSAGVVSITSAAPVGSHTITIRATDNCGAMNDATFTLNVNPGALHHFAIGSISSPQTAGTAFNITITAQDSNNNTVTSFTGAVGLSTTAGTISPTTSGVFTNGTLTQSMSVTASGASQTISVNDGSSHTGMSNSFTVNAGALHHFAIGNIGTQTAGTPFNITITAQDSNNNTVTSFTGTVGLSTTAGTISPTTSSAFSGGTLNQMVTVTQAGASKTITVDDGNSHTGMSNNFTVNVGGVHHFAITSIATQTAGTAFNITITAQDANNNTVTGFIGTVSLSTTAGTISPTTSGAFTSGTRTQSVTVTQSGSNKTISVNDGSGHTGMSNSFTVVCPTITLSPTSLLNPTAGTQYSQTLTASGGTPNYSFTVPPNSLPNGLSLASNGTLSGTPTQTGAFTFTVTATDANGCTGSRGYTLQIDCFTITLAPSSLPAGTVGAAYTNDLSASGGIGSYTFTVTSGSVPTGLTLNSNGTWSGTATASSTFNFTVKAADTNGCFGTKAYQVVIGCPSITLTPASLNTGLMGAAYSQTLTPSGGSGSYTFNVTGLPNGLTANATTSNVTLGGTPTQAGNFTINVTITNNGCTSSQQFTLVINAPQPLPGDVRLSADFDGDGKADLAIWRPSTATFWVFTSATTTTLTKQLGSSTDVPVPRDYDGDGKTDFAVWQPSTATFLICHSSNGATLSWQWGAATDVPVPGDYDGDGKADLAIWRPSTGVWWIYKSSNGGTINVQWGAAGDVPVPGDYDGDGKIDLAWWRASTATFWIYSIAANTVTTKQWGASTDVPVPSDYDGDGKTDIAVWRPATATWIICQSTNEATVTGQWGSGTDVPVPSDYDGDGKADLGVWRPSNGMWMINKSSNGGTISAQWGMLGDVPMS